MPLNPPVSSMMATEFTFSRRLLTTQAPPTYAKPRFECGFKRDTRTRDHVAPNIELDCGDYVLKMRKCAWNDHRIRGDCCLKTHSTESSLMLEHHGIKTRLIFRVHVGYSDVKMFEILRRTNACMLPRIFNDMNKKLWWSTWKLVVKVVTIA